MLLIKNSIIIYRIFNCNLEFKKLKSRTMIRKEEYLFNKGYIVSLEGKVYNPKKEEVIGFIGSTGYPQSKMKIKGRAYSYSFHRLHAYQKYGEKLYEPGIVVRHLDGNPLNNSYDNIAIGTHSQNMMDKPQSLRISMAFHAASFKKKYENETVIEFYNKCKSYQKTMKYFNISSKGTLHYILNGRNKK